MKGKKKNPEDEKKAEESSNASKGNSDEK